MFDISTRSKDLLAVFMLYYYYTFVAMHKHTSILSFLRIY